MRLNNLFEKGKILENKQFEGILGRVIPWYRYLQVKHLAMFPQIQQAMKRPLTEFEHIIKTNDGSPKSLISKLYKLLFTLERKKLLRYQIA